MKKGLRILSLLILVLLILPSCSAKNSSDMMMVAETGKASYDIAAEAEAYADYDYYSFDAPASASRSDVSYMADTVNKSSESIADTRKIIKTVSLELETKTFDKAVEDIISTATAIGGYVESSYVSGNSLDKNVVERYATFTIRVPAKQLDSYVAGLSDTYNVISTNTNSSDITDSYYDTEARLNSLLTQEERLLAMLEGATELEYMLQIENTLANVRYQIESYYSTLKRYDSQVSMSTVSISLNEVVEYQIIKEKPKTFGEKMADAFKNSWTEFGENCLDFMVDLTYSLPTLLIWAVVIAVAIILIRRGLKKRRLKKQKALETAPDDHIDIKKDED